MLMQMIAVAYQPTVLHCRLVPAQQQYYALGHLVSKGRSCLQDVSEGAVKVLIIRRRSRR